MKKAILYIVIPCYNEEEVLEETTKQLKRKIEKLIAEKNISYKSRIMYVDDGSKDNTWNLISNISCGEKYFTGISLAKNVGQQNALMAGLLEAKKYADIVISMDSDLQDDIDAIDSMLKKYYGGAEIVYGVRSSRKSDNFLKKISALSFYKVMKKLGANIIYNHAEYRLTSKNVLNHLEEFNEVNIFLRGIFPLIGFKSDIVYYNRNKRLAGKTKYSFKKLLNLSWEAITSFSIQPIRFILKFGMILAIFSFISLTIFVVCYITETINNFWCIIISLICLLFGIQFTFIGIVGEYVGKAYIETKKRPRYIIEKNLNEVSNEVKRFF